MKFQKKSMCIAMLAVIMLMTTSAYATTENNSANQDDTPKASITQYKFIKKSETDMGLDKSRAKVVVDWTAYGFERTVTKTMLLEASFTPSVSVEAKNAINSTLTGSLTVSYSYSDSFTPRPAKEMQQRIMIAPYISRVKGSMQLWAVPGGFVKEYDQTADCIYAHLVYAEDKKSDA